LLPMVVYQWSWNWHYPSCGPLKICAILSLPAKPVVMRLTNPIKNESPFPMTTRDREATSSVNATKRFGKTDAPQCYQRPWWAVEWNTIFHWGRHFIFQREEEGTVTTKPRNDVNPAWTLIRWDHPGGPHHCLDHHRFLFPNSHHDLLANDTEVMHVSRVGGIVLIILSQSMNEHSMELARKQQIVCVVVPIAAGRRRRTAPAPATSTSPIL